MGPEAEAREEIDEMLEAAGWEVQDYGNHNLGENGGYVIVREFQIGMDAADYLIFLDRQATGVIEAKPKGTTLTGVRSNLAAIQKVSRRGCTRSNHRFRSFTKPQA
jgi:type I restriction enzyme R subunit